MQCTSALCHKTLGFMSTASNESGPTQPQRTSAASCSSDRSVRPLCSEDVGADDSCRRLVAGRATAGADFAAADRALVGPLLQIRTRRLAVAAAAVSGWLTAGHAGS
jgi:hypothetical protein